MKFIYEILKKFRRIIIAIIAFLAFTAGSTVQVFPPESVTPTEYLQIVKMYDTEIQNLGGINIEVKDGNIFEAVNAKLREGAISDETEQLIRKAENSMEKMSLIDKIIK